MIYSIKGKIIKQEGLSIHLDVNGIGYEVFVPMAVMVELNKSDASTEVTFVTYHYYASDPSKSIPILIGFNNEIEKEFFLKFIGVSGIGPKAAVKALNRPISEIAQAIDRGDTAVLKSLPGIGAQRAKEIVVKLQDKVGKFGLIQDKNRIVGDSLKEDIEEEAMYVLIQLQYKKQEAKDMIRKALARNSSISNSEELLNEVYKQRIARSSE
ncbi:MAG: Holliday junction branch migration protein RuvA [Candidatus Omnitrophota bacterium]